MQSLQLFISIAITLILARKLGIGISLLISSFILGIFTVGFNGLINCYLQLQSVELMLVVFLTYTLANTMDNTGMLEKLSKSLNESFGSLSIALIPLLIGLIPMPAGALVSASMLLPITKDSKISPEKLTVINYWFRHVWTPVWPLYPSVIIALAVLGVQYEHYLFATLPIALVSFILGFTLLRGLSFNLKISGLRKMVSSLYPIFILLALYLITKILLLSIAVSLLMVIILEKEKLRNFRRVIKKSLDFRVLILVFAVMGYKNIIQLSNSARILYEEMSFVPLEISALLVSFLVGFSTGIEVSYSSISLPIFHEFAKDPGNLLLLISAGFFGVMLSPFHLCYALTVEYFKAKFMNCYKMLIKLTLPSILILLILALII
ncbi:MAG: DUF401 family protein [Archaeoglobaceae archaeon]